MLPCGFVVAANPDTDDAAMRFRVKTPRSIALRKAYEAFMGNDWRGGEMYDAIGAGACVRKREKVAQRAPLGEVRATFQ